MTEEEFENWIEKNTYEDGLFPVIAVAEVRKLYDLLTPRWIPVGERLPGGWVRGMENIVQFKVTYTQEVLVGSLDTREDGSPIRWYDWLNWDQTGAATSIPLDQVLAWCPLMEREKGVK